MQFFSALNLRIASSVQGFILRIFSEFLKYSWLLLSLEVFHGLTVVAVSKLAAAVLWVGLWLLLLEGLAVSTGIWLRDLALAIVFLLLWLRLVVIVQIRRSIGVLWALADAFEILEDHLSHGFLLFLWCFHWVTAWTGDKHERGTLIDDLVVADLLVWNQKLLKVDALLPGKVVYWV